mgnify:CR=1 FL=1
MKLIRKAKRNKGVLLLGFGVAVVMLVIPQTEGYLGKLKWTLRNMVGLGKKK